MPKYAQPPSFLPELRLPNSLLTAPDPAFEDALARQLGATGKPQQRTMRMARRYVQWCQEHGRAAVPVDHRDVFIYFDYLRNEEGRSLSYLRKSLTAINSLQYSNGFMVTSSGLILAFMRRVKGETVIRKMTPLSPEDVCMLCNHAEAIEKPLAAARNVAMLLLGYASGLRPKSLLSLVVANVGFCREGVELTLRRLKSSDWRISIKRVRASANLERCPKAALQRWLALSGLVSGPIFRGITRFDTVRPRALAVATFGEMICRYAAALELQGTFGTYSLRRGHATYADRAGAALEDIRSQLDHVHSDTTRGYIDAAPLAWDRVPDVLP